MEATARHRGRSFGSMIDRPSGMPADRDPLARAFLGLIALATMVRAIVSVVVRPQMYSDSAFGFRVWDSMRQGGGFNHLLNADDADIARDIAYFKAVWTPGQYVFPGLFEWLGTDLGIAIAIVVTLCSALGLWGWYALYRTFGFSPRTSAVALLVVAFGRHFGLPFGIYNGGEVLLFAGIPWAFLLVWRLRDLPWRSVVPLVAAAGAIAFLKLSGIIFFGAAVSAIVPRRGQSLLGRETLHRAIVAAVVLGVSALLLQWAWVSRWTAAQQPLSVDWSQLGPAVAYAISNTWTCIFGFGSLLKYLFFAPGRPLLTSDLPLNLALVIPALATGLFMWLQLRDRYADYARFTMLATAAVAVVFVLLLLRGSVLRMEPSMDERHFRPLALLLTVGLVEAFLGARSIAVRGLFFALAGLAIAYGLGSSAHHLRTNLADPLGSRGVRLHNLPPAALAFLRSIDRPDADGDRPLILVPNPEVALEVRNARVLLTHADFETAESLAAQPRRGRVRRLYVLMDRAMERNGKAAILLKSLVDYPSDSWTRTEVGNFVVYSSTP